MATRILRTASEPEVTGPTGAPPSGTHAPNAPVTGTESAATSAQHASSNSLTDDSTDGPDVAGDKLPKHSIGRALLVAVFAAAIVSVVLLAFSWPTVTADPRDLPIAAVGSADDVDRVADNAPDGMLDLEEADSRADAVQKIRQREVYGALVFTGGDPEILVSSAASPAVARQLRGIASDMQQAIDEQAISGMQGGMAQMQEALEAATEAAENPGQGPAGSAESSGAGVPAGASEVPGASAMAVPHVTVTDVAPLSDDDASGAGLAIAGLPLTIGGIVGGVLTSLLVHSRRMRAVAVVAYGVIGGIALALILQTWFGILQGDFWLNAAAAGLAVAATAAIINGFVSLIGPGGIAVGAVLTMFIGNPISSLNQPKEFLAGAWGEIGQFFVPGAAGTLLRDLSYFPDAPMAASWWVLVSWFVLGVALILIGHMIAHAKLRAARHGRH